MSKNLKSCANIYDGLGVEVGRKEQTQENYQQYYNSTHKPMNANEFDGDNDGYGNVNHTRDSQLGYYQG